MVDLSATILDIAGAAADFEIDGQVIAPARPQSEALAPHVSKHSISEYWVLGVEEGAYGGAQDLLIVPVLLTDLAPSKVGSTLTTLTVPSAFTTSGQRATSLILTRSGALASASYTTWTRTRRRFATFSSP